LERRSRLSENRKDKWFTSTVYDYTSEQRKEIEQLLDK